MAERLVAFGCSASSCCTAHSSSSSQARVSWALPARNATWVSSTGLRTADFTLSCTGLSMNAFKHRGVQQRRRHLLKVRAAAGPDDGVKWWEKDGGPNMRDIHSTQEFIDALASAGDKLVIVEFFASWCGSCRALYPKLCKLAEEHREIEFLKVNFDENKPMCKRLNVKVLPYFHFYRGADGRLDHFSCSLAKLQKLKDAMQLHNTERCSLGPALGVGDLLSTPDQTAAAGSTR